MTVLSGALTIKHYNDIIDSFVKNVADSSKSYYIFFGKPDPWDDDLNPPQAIASVAEYEQTNYDDLIYGKLIKSDDIGYVIPRIDWTSGTVYDQYDQSDENLYTKQFYVITNGLNVYKCIDNNYGAKSTVKPILTTTSGTFQTADGYVWKYMYTVSDGINQKFSSNKFIPLEANGEVKANSVFGTLDHIRVVDGGKGYSTYTHGFVDAFNPDNPNTIQLANNAARNNFSRQNNFYQGSSLYLKSGFGAGQLRKISSSDGNAKTVRVSDPLDVYSRMQLSNIVGQDDIVVGLTVTQRLHKIDYTYLVNYFNEGDVIIQSDTLATANVISANATSLVVETDFDNDPSLASSAYHRFVVNKPFYKAESSGTIKTDGTVNITLGSAVVTGSSGTNFLTGLAVGNFIRVGTNPSKNIRRIISIADAHTLTVDTPFDNTSLSSAYYLLSTAANPVSIGLATNATGYIYDTNIKGVELKISNPSILGVNFRIGENVEMVDGLNALQGANGIVTYSNSSTVIINNKNGLDFLDNFSILGSDSLLKADIDSVKNFPNITIENPTGRFRNGVKIRVRPSDNLKKEVANATLVSLYYTPNESTEYLIVPTITITGDGEGAAAYPIINNVSNSINSIVMVNTGVGYTYANLTVTANTLYGHGAMLTPVISPIHGHGYDIEQELGCRYASISVNFAGTEGYTFPAYGTYRKVGILEDPLFNEVTLDLGAFERITLRLDNVSGTFVENEIVTQTGNSTSKPAGIVSAVYTGESSTTFLELKNINNSGEWLYNSTGDNIQGHLSFATANVTATDINYFHFVGSPIEIVSETKSGANAYLYEAEPARIDYEAKTQRIKLTNVSGSFDANDTVVDYITNSYANVVAIYTSNGYTDVTTTFGSKFNQTARVTLNRGLTVSTEYNDFEYVHQDVTNASGKIIEQWRDCDLLIQDLTGGEFVVGDTISDTSTNGSGIVIAANSTYLKLTGVNYYDPAVLADAFVAGDSINNDRGVSATVATPYKVLVLSDVDGPMHFQPYEPLILGQEIPYIRGIGSPRDGIEASGAKFWNQTANSITLPDLVRETGTVLYINNLQPFERSNSSNEKVNFVIKF